VGHYATPGPRPVWLAGPGDLLGLEAWHASTPPRHRGFARALTETALLFAPGDAWARALDRSPVRELVLSALVQLVLDQQALASRRDQPEQAVAWALARWGMPRDHEVELPAPAATLAAILGLSRNALRQAVARLTKLNAARQVNGHLRGDPRRLRELLEEPLTASAR